MSFGFGFGFPKNYIAALFNPAQLFTTGVNGAWYDPSDLSTLYQNAAGTTPVTAVEQPVGLMLDKSKGLVLGPELVTNGTFDTDTSWNKSAWWTISGGSASMPSTSSYYPLAQNLGVSTGKFYQITFSVLAITGTMKMAFDDATLASNTVVGEFSTTGTKSFIFSPPAGETYIVFARVATQTASVTIDNISVRELPGNHAFNPSGNSANFPVLSARYNLLTKTEQFDDAVWVKSAASIQVNATTAPDGTLTADKLIPDASLVQHRVNQTPTSVAGSQTATVYVKAAGYNYVWFRIGFLGAAWSLIDGSKFFTDAGVTASASLVENGWYKLSITLIASANDIVRVNALPTASVADFSGDGTSGIYIWGASLTPTNDSLNQPAYQRVNTATDYDTVGFRPYLRFNGVNQWLQTNSIDFTYGDKMFVAAGVRKLSDAANNLFCELSADTNANNGAFSIFAPIVSGGLNTYFSVSKGTTAASTGTGTSSFAAPITNVLSGLGNISGDQAILRVNGTQAAISTADQGTGNFGNYPLYIGARAGSSLWFNGRLYGMVIAGKAASASEIASTEQYINQKTRAY